jgi:oxygen-dependent protoporphyrinogen oxidase
VRRHFGADAATTIAGPLLAAVFGGDIAQLSVRAVMPAFVRMEAEEGSLIQAVQRRVQPSSPAIFTTLASGLQTLIDRMVDRLPAASVRLRKPVERIEVDDGGLRISTADGSAKFDAVVLATPPHVTGPLLRQINQQGSRITELLPQQATSAIVVALAFAPEQAARLRIPRGFGFVVPQAAGQNEAEEYPLLACTFVDQKFPGRVPQGAILLRAFFGGHSGAALLNESDDKLIERARRQLGRVLGPLPQTVETVVRRWPLSLPQYVVGHLDRMAEIESILAALPTLRLVGSAYYGVGLPDLVRQGRSAARSLSAQPQHVAN